MKAIDQSFVSIINGTTQFVIPVFQRDYTWTEDQCAQLWSDVLQIAKGSPDARHFLGSLVYTPTGDSTASFTRWLLIDGQQRMTTILLMLAALRDHITETGWLGKEGGPSAKRLDAYFLKNLQEEGNRQHKLVLRRHDHTTFKAIIHGQEMPDPGSERLKEAYEFFRDQLTDADVADAYEGICRLVVVDVSLDRKIDNPQLIFESLNSTGMDLSQSDLIRNFILMGLPEKEQTRLYENYWQKIESLFRESENVFDAFARDYVALRTRASKQEKTSEIYRAFRRFFVNYRNEFGSLDEALADLQRFARYHAAFSLGRPSAPIIAEPLARLRHLVDVPAILIMRLYDCHKRLTSLSESDFVEALDLLESYVFRRAICGNQTRGYWQVFANMAYRIQEENPLESLKIGLATQHDNYRFPTDEEFGQSLRERDLYGLRVCRHLLERLENQGTREPTDTRSYSIEHIMPQNKKVPVAWRKMLGEDWKEIHRMWLHRLGNLTLTGYNAKYKDLPFEKKKTIPDGFAESAVRLNKFVREQEVWTEREMKRRTTKLSRKALQVWPALEVAPALVAAARRQRIQDLAGQRDVADVRMSEKARALFETLRQQVTEIDEGVMEVAESKSVSYHGQEFFLEVLPRKHRLTLLLPLDFNEVDDPEGLAEDATEYKFFVNATYSGGVALRIGEEDDIALAMPIIRESFAMAGT